MDWMIGLIKNIYRKSRETCGVSCNFSIFFPSNQSTKHYFVIIPATLQAVFAPGKASLEMPCEVQVQKMWRCWTCIVCMYVYYIYSIYIYIGWYCHTVCINISNLVYLKFSCITPPMFCRPFPPKPQHSQTGTSLRACFTNFEANWPSLMCIVSPRARWEKMFSEQIGPCKSVISPQERCS